MKSDNKLYTNLVNTFKKQLLESYMKEFYTVSEVSRQTGLSRNTIYKLLKLTDKGDKHE